MLSLRNLLLLAFAAGVLMTGVVEERVSEAHEEGEAGLPALIRVGGFGLHTPLCISWLVNRRLILLQSIVCFLFRTVDESHQAPIDEQVQHRGAYGQNVHIQRDGNPNCRDR